MGSAASSAVPHKLSIKGGVQNPPVAQAQVLGQSTIYDVQYVLPEAPPEEKLKDGTLIMLKQIPQEWENLDYYRNALLVKWRSECDEVSRQSLPKLTKSAVELFEKKYAWQLNDEHPDIDIEPAYELTRAALPYLLPGRSYKLILHNIQQMVVRHLEGTYPLTKELFLEKWISVHEELTQKYKQKTGQSVTPFCVVM